LRVTGSGPRLSLIVTTYQRPDALQAVLATALAQSEAPFEILVADDGSTDATAEVVRAAAARSAVPLRHLWHAHEGFRLTHTRNRAIAAAQGDYLVFIDGDMLLHPEFVADHRRLARRGWFTQGVRVLLDERRTAQQLAAPGPLPGVLSAGLGGLRRAYAWHAPVLAGRLRTLANHLISIKGCNQGFWRSDLESVNGFNEDITGWGPEDKELCARLGFAGIRRQSLLCGGIAFHLHHAAAPRERRAANEAIYAATLDRRAIRCTHGLDRHRA
jgi:glycosyltransferase involved in cell wall biosynthesis